MATAAAAAVSPLSYAGGSLAHSLSRAQSSVFLFEHEFAQDNPGALSDFYTVDSVQLGEGSFGSVSCAKCKQTGARRAVKAIDVSAVKNPTRFDQEITIAKQLDHPNVVRLFETFRDTQKIYLVMELCTGGELFDRIVDEAPSGFDEHKAARHVREILSAICYMHAHKFAHRDVKPENFLFGSRSPDAPLKIIDFGLACAIDPARPMTTKAGTAYYVAPEVLKGDYNERCDIWSVGVISYVLLCGYPPFSGDTDPEILRKVRDGNFEFRSPEWDTISSGAKNLVTQMLTVDPTLRPAADELLLSPWLRFKGTPEPAPISAAFVERLQGFRAHSRLKRVALAAVAQQLPDDDIEALRKTFRALDKNGDGTLTHEEVRDGLAQRGLEVPPSLEEIMRSIDCNGTGSVDYTEWIAATLDQKLCTRKDVCWAAFRTFDLDGDGKITREDLSKVLSGSGAQRVKALGARKIEKMILEADTTGDGAINFEEFCSMMESSSPTAKAPLARPQRPAKRSSAATTTGAGAKEAAASIPPSAPAAAVAKRPRRGGGGAAASA